MLSAARVWGRSHGLELVLKPRRMQQRQMSQRMMTPMGGCSPLFQFLGFPFLPKSSCEHQKKPLWAVEPVGPQLTLQQLFA